MTMSVVDKGPNFTSFHLEVWVILMALGFWGAPGVRAIGSKESAP